MSHVEKNEEEFRETACNIASELYCEGDEELGDYILCQFSNYYWCVPNIENFPFFKRCEIKKEPLLLSENIYNEMLGIVNAIKNGNENNKILLYGLQGSGKSESAKQIARILGYNIYQVCYDRVIGSSVSLTVKNIEEVFRELNKICNPKDFIILFDDIDYILMKSTVPTIIEGLKALSRDLTIIATTSDISSLPQNLLSVFNKRVSFDRYTKDDLEDIANRLIHYFFLDYRELQKDEVIFNKILKLCISLPSPSNIKSIIKESLAFSNGKGYLGNIYKRLLNISHIEISVLKEQGFTIDEMEKITNRGRGDIARLL